MDADSQQDACLSLCGSAKGEDGCGVGCGREWAGFDGLGSAALLAARVGSTCWHSSIGCLSQGPWVFAVMRAAQQDTSGPPKGDTKGKLLPQ